MSYPPPPGINNLPARPPAASKPGFKPAFNAASHQPSHAYSSTSSYPSAPGYASAPTSQYGPTYPSYPGGAAPSTAAGMSAPASAYSYQQQSQNYGQSSYGQPSTYAAAPQIRNPFPMPGQGGGAAAPPSDYDPEMAAQIAQWQSAYVNTKDTDRDGKPVATAYQPKPETPPVQQPANPDKKKTVVREGGGKKWTDETLLEWDPSHLRLFVGNLAGETTDESLLKAFSRWKSVQKARVIRDKRTSKSKGYGFVSFSDADDFFQSAKEMNGKYIQSHPIVVRKANTEIKVTNVKERDRGGKNKKKGGNHGGRQNFDPNLGPTAGAGVTKPGQKTKNGLRLLG